MKHILVTGGAGYIGSHTCLELLKAGYQLTVVDNLSNSKQEALNRVEQLSHKKIDFFQLDILDEKKLEAVFLQQKPDAVIHFAGSKAVADSQKNPLSYYHNNIATTINLLRIMNRCHVKNFVFSSSATVYGIPHSVPVTEDFPLKPENTYGRTKLYIENICRDLFSSDPQWSISLLRYFNPVGAHASGKIGEDPNGSPDNLLPYIAQVAIGRKDKLMVFGDDYATKDGTGVRDYIHVVDLALGHVKALQYIKKQQGISTFNLGTGKGYSVLDIVHAFEKCCDHKIHYQIAPRRLGDIDEYFADPTLANKELNWKASRDLEEIVADTWHWQQSNPSGYISSV